MNNDTTKDNKNNILYIAGETEDFVCGYINAFFMIGYNTNVLDTPSKLNTQEAIENFGVDIICCNISRIEKVVPIKYINDHNIKTIIHVDDLNKLETAQDIKNKVFWTYDKDHSSDEILFIPLAGDMTYGIPEKYEKNKNIIIVGDNLGDKSVVDKWIVPIATRLNTLKRNFTIYGDRFVINNPVSNTYANSDVVINIQDVNKNSLNDYTYSISLSNGFQMTNHPLSKEYFKDLIYSENNVTKFMKKLESVLSNDSPDKDICCRAMQHTVKNHTYLNRLHDIFKGFGDEDMCDIIKTKTESLTEKYIWEIDTVINNKQFDKALI